MGGGAGSKLWIGLAVVLGIVAIGLAIWGFDQKSDLDKANDRIAKIEKQAAAGERSQAATNAALEGFGKREVAKYRRTRRALISADKRDANFKNEVTREANALEQARNELGAAQTAEEKQAAQAKVARATSSAAIRCAQATVDAIGAFDTKAAVTNSPDPAESAMNQLAALVGPCKTVLNSGG